MTPDEARAAVAECIGRIAPEIDLSTVDPRGRLRDQVDLDSLDFLTLVQALHERTGVAIPEEDYGSVDTLDRLTGYLVAHAGAGV